MIPLSWQDIFLPTPICGYFLLNFSCYKIMEIDKTRDPERPTAMAYQEASMADIVVFCPSKEIGTNLSCFQGTFFGTLWTWRTVLRLSTQVKHSTRKNQIHTVAVDLPPIYQAVFAFRSHKWMLSQNDEHLTFNL